MNSIIVKYFKIIAYTECILGLILLSKEIVNYTHLLSIQEINNKFGELGEWFYKESCYKYFLLYSLLIITGISFWINKKLYWGLTQVLLMTLFFVVIINLWFESLFPLWIGICLGILSLIIFTYLEIKMCSSLFLQTMRISKMTKWLFFVVGGLFCAIWLFLW